LLGPDRVCASAKIVIASEVIEVCVSFPLNLNVSGLKKSTHSILEADQLNVAPLLLVPEQSINDVLTARGLFAHEDEANFEVFVFLPYY
jgi:hypothetical protein